MQFENQRTKRTRTNLLVDIIIFLAFLIVMAPRFTGMVIHEWLGFAFGAAIITHLLLHWQWIVATTQRILSAMPRAIRINYLLNALLFIDVTLIAFTGVMISESALPSLGITFARNFAWRGLHELTANLSLLLIGLHIALHWQWIVSFAYSHLIAPLTTYLRLPTAESTLAQRELK